MRRHGTTSFLQQTRREASSELNTQVYKRLSCVTITQPTSGDCWMHRCCDVFNLC